MRIYLDHLEQRAKRLRAVEITLQSLLAYLVGASLVGLASWAVVFVKVVQQMPEILSWEEPEALLTLLRVPGQYLLYAFLAGIALYGVARTTLFSGSASYRLAMWALLAVLGVQLVMGTVSAVELTAIRARLAPWYVVSGLAMAYLVGQVAAAARASGKLSADERGIVQSSTKLPFFSWRSFKRVTGVPEIVDFLRRRRGFVAVLFFLAACGSAYLPAYFSTSHGAIWLQAWSLRFTCERLDNGPNCMADFLAQGEDLGRDGRWVAYLMLPLALAVGLLWVARRNVRLSVDELLGSDRRAPVLFLRAFKDDQVPLPSGRQPLLLWLLGLGRIPTSLDQILLEEGTPHGPVVALGNPSDPLPPYGVARGYFSHDDWQAAVAKLAADASAIVICVDDSAGVWWEIDLIAREGYLPKTCILLHPRYSGRSENSEIIGRLSHRLGLAGSATEELLSVEEPPVMLFFLDPNGAVMSGRGTRPTRMGFILGTRWFLRSRGALPS